ncbi:universal stress protein [Slackia faecicanis]|uniref:Universal stress protein n=1 Tax=Slackia faecicanis TaxID=255723 RepID=A0A3N0AHW5_9ACTN|nr:universal stress protein [Slackia faecicanis]MDO5358264.1 universal stress protein [Slackia faecicanis]RNL21727.1 universal stress protein [Slackia faecicanis]
MALEKILVAYDGSEAASAALDLAADIGAGNDEIGIDVVNVVAIPLLSDDQLVSFASVLDLMERDAEALLTDAVARLDEHDIDNDVETYILNGTDTATEIAKLAEQDDYDIVIIGSRGLGGIKGYLGSVGHKLLSICSKPVLIAK